MVGTPGLRARPARKSTLHIGTVHRTERLGPSMVRIVVGGPGLSGLAPNGFTDAYVKVVFLRPGVDYPRPIDLEQIRADLPADQWPQQRTYTVRRWDQGAGEIVIDVVVHGEEGLAGPWASSAGPGDEVLLLGPGGGYRPDPAADWHLFAGDESALPAIAAALEQLPADAEGHALIEVHQAGDEQKLFAPGGVQVQWLYRDAAPFGQSLVRAVSQLEFLPGRVQAFVHGEAGFVRELRRVLRIERQLSAGQLSISGYWRLGADDEGWRARKREWNLEIEQAEAAAGLS